MENNNKIPFYDEIEIFLNMKFNKIEIEKTEYEIIKILNYNLNIKTPYTFIIYFLSKGLI